MKIEELEKFIEDKIKEQTFCTINIKESHNLSCAKDSEGKYGKD